MKIKLNACLAIATLALGASAFAADDAAMAPKDVCKKIVETTKNAAAQNTKVDPTQVQQWVYSDERGGKMHHGHKGQGKAQGKWHAMNEQLRTEIGNTTCNSETVAGNHAFVAAKSGDDERLIPFVKTGNTWKMDLAAYRMMYRMDQRAPASTSTNTDSNMNTTPSGSDTSSQSGTTPTTPSSDATKTQ